MSKKSDIWVEHIDVDGLPACKQTGRVILFQHGQDVDPDLVCKRCKQSMAWRSHVHEVENGPFEIRIEDL